MSLTNNSEWRCRACWDDLTMGASMERATEAFIMLVSAPGSKVSLSGC